MQSQSTQLSQSDKIDSGNEKDHYTTNPFNGEKVMGFNFIPEGTAKDYIQKSHDVYLKWKAKPLKERKEVITRFSSLLKEKSEELAQLITDEMGKPINAARGEIKYCASICDYCVENADEFLKDRSAAYSKGHALITHEAQGVIFSIQPWNFPFYQAIRYSVPNLLAGNTTVHKHAKNVWGCSLKIEELFLEAGLPEFAFKNLFVESSSVEGLIGMREIRGVTLTGGDAVGKKIAAIAGRELKKCVMELGGNDAYIVTKNADLKDAARVCANGRLKNSGQVCTAAKRFIVEESVYDDFKKHFIEEFKQKKVGDPNQSDSDVGPLAKRSLLETLHEQVQESVQKGANVVFRSNFNLKQGHFSELMILDNLSSGMPAYDDELFGPVASLIKVRDIDEAIEVANSSRYGLGSGVLTEDNEEGLAIARRLDAGMSGINCVISSEAQLPFGGVKNSGFGREHEKFGFHEFVNIKTITIRELKK